MNIKTKLVAGGLSIAAVAAGAALTGNTSAYFYDLEKSTGNSLEACDFDLTYRMSNLTAVTSAPSSQAQTSKTTADNQVVNGGNGSFSISNLQPGDSYKLNVNVRNSGTCAGELYSDMDNYVDNENGITEPEAAAGDTDASGDMGETLNLKLVQDGYLTVHNGTLQAHADAIPRVVDNDFTGGDEHTLVYTFTVPNGERGAENVIMGDSFAFDLDFAIAQKGQVTPATIGNLG